jgi:DNA polymerase-3 subunit gamma/tau
VPPAAPPAPRAPESFVALIAVLDRVQPHLAQQLHDYASLVRYAPPELVLHPRRPIDGNLAAALKQVCDIGWRVELTEAAGEPTLREQELAAEAAAAQAVLDSPMVAAVMTAFPGAEIVKERS